jgi:PAS domain-containing protein
MNAEQASATASGPQQLGVPVLARILSASADAIVIIDSNRRFVYANPAAGEIAGRIKHAADFFILVPRDAAGEGGQ